MKTSSLETKIATLQGLKSSEADVSNHLRDLLTASKFGIGLKAAQIQVDTANLPDSRRRPDLAIFATENGQPVCTVDNMVAVIELKRSNTLTAKLASVLTEKRDYVQPATRHFYLVDQANVWRYDIVERADAKTWTWEQLKDPAVFAEAFGVISASEMRLEEQLARFQDGRTRFAHLSIEQYKKPAFIRTISEVSQTLQSAIDRLIADVVKIDLERANECLATMQVWGAPVFDWNMRSRPIEFARALNENKPLTDEEVSKYEDDHDRFDADVQPYLYALEIEHRLLARYADRLALDQPSLLKERFKKGKATPSGKAIASLAYETGALIMSRMLMVRFAEDHRLFTTRYISNGGIRVFSDYARHFQRRMQALLKETYRASSQLFAHLFDENLLDWALDREDDALSHAILKCAYLLSRWDFTTAHGDILSGVYDKYLDTSRRRALGEVYTRPEVARYMLQLAGVDKDTTVLDPACGTGTFLVEALVEEIARLRAKGLHRDIGALQAALQRFAGLDINDFAIVLAQIQVIWHLIEILAGATADEIRSATRRLIPTINLAGGWSSLHTLGHAFNQLSTGAAAAAAQTSLVYAVQRGEGRRAAESAIPRKFSRILRSSYDVVVANPPYVRAHRQGGADYDKSYPEVAYGATDLYVFFIYRALKQWVRPGGRLAVIVPIAVMDADYAAPLRAVLREHRITHIVDLESLGRHTFHGIKRNTVILVIERVEASSGDAVVVVTVPPNAYDEAADAIDFTKAQEEVIPLAKLNQDAFLPPRSTMLDWIDTLERQEGKRAPLLSKIKAADLPVLDQLAAAPRLGSITKTAFTRKVKDEPLRIEERVPHGENPRLWRHEMVAGVGVELGGAAAFAAQGDDIWKGQNIFPGGVEGTPIANGKWDPATSRPKSAKIYQYAGVFETEKLYAVRDIAQLPTACPAPPGAAFQNSAVMVQLTESWPLDLYLLSRIPLWYAARVLRSTILQDLGCHWYKKTIPFIPIPQDRSSEVVGAIAEIGARAVKIDRHLQNRHAAVEAFVAAAEQKPLRMLMLSDDPLTEGLDAEHVSLTPLRLTGVREDGTFIVSDDLLFRLAVPDSRLRAYLTYDLRRRSEANTEATITRDELLEVQVPISNLNDVVDLIVADAARDGIAEFEEALQELDRIVGEAFGLTEDSIAYIAAEMRDDPILSRMRPMLRQRGVRIQAYAEAGNEDRYG